MMLEAAVRLATLFTVVALSSACASGRGPRLQLTTPPSPNFGDHSSVAAERARQGPGAGGGGVAPSSGDLPAAPNGAGSPALAVGAGAVGVGAAAATVGLGLVTCEPGTDTPHGERLNVCSGERRAAPPP